MYKQDYERIQCLYVLIDYYTSSTGTLPSKLNDLDNLLDNYDIFSFGSNVGNSIRLVNYRDKEDRFKSEDGSHFIYDPSTGLMTSNIIKNASSRVSNMFNQLLTGTIIPMSKKEEEKRIIQHENIRISKEHLEREQQRERDLEDARAYYWRKMEDNLIDSYKQDTNR